MDYGVVMRGFLRLGQLGCLALIAWSSTASAGAAVGNRVDLVLRVSGPSAVDAGHQVEYTLRVNLKAGAPQRSLRLMAVLPRTLESVRFVPGTGRYDRRTGVWRSVALARGKPLVMRVRATVSRSASAGQSRVTFRLAPRAGLTDFAALNNAGAATTLVRRPARRSDLGVTIDDGRGEGVRGSTASYVVTITNAGPAAVQGARVRLTVPSEVENSSFTAPSAGTYDSAAATWTGINLPAGASATLRFSGTLSAPAGTDARVVAAIVSSGASTDANAANNSATDVTSAVAPAVPSPAPSPVPVPPAPAPPTGADFAVSVTSSGTFASRTYIFTITNRGPALSQMAGQFNMTAGTISDVVMSRGRFHDKVFYGWEDPQVFAVGESQTMTMIILNAVDPSVTVTGALPDPDTSNNVANG